MTSLIYYVARSIDGYIAASDGNIDWLSLVERAGEDYGYTDFYNSVDALIIGRKTYAQVLKFSKWPYPGKPCFVTMRTSLSSEREDVRMTSKSPWELIGHLTEEGIKRAWLVGGGAIAVRFRKQGLIEEYIVSIVPVYSWQRDSTFCRKCRIC